MEIALETKIRSIERQLLTCYNTLADEALKETPDPETLHAYWIQKAALEADLEKLKAKHQDA